MPAEIKRSPWYPYIDKASLSALPGSFSPAIAAKNPHYKAFIGGWVTEVEIWPTYAEGTTNNTVHLDTNYSVTDNLPFEFSGDFTLYINPFRCQLKKNNGSTATEKIVIGLQQRWSSTAELGGRSGNWKGKDIWTNGILVFGEYDNIDPGDLLDGVSSRVVIDKDDAVHESSFLSTEKFGYLNDDTYALSMKQLGTSKSNDYRFAIGIGNNAANEILDGKNKLHLICVPHKTRRTPTS